MFTFFLNSETVIINVIINPLYSSRMLFLNLVVFSFDQFRLSKEHLLVVREVKDTDTY